AFRGHGLSLLVRSAHCGVSRLMLFPLESPPFVPINEVVFQIGIPNPANGICETPMAREASMRPHRPELGEAHSPLTESDYLPFAVVEAHNPVFLIWGSTFKTRCTSSPLILHEG